MRALLVVITGVVALAQLPQTPQEVTDFLASTAGALSEAHSIEPTIASDAGPFLEQFDPNMPGYTDLRNNVEALVAEAMVGSSIEVVSDAGDDQKRTMELDWIMDVENQGRRRQIVKVTIEKEKKKWKFTALSPIDFFRP